MEIENVLGGELYPNKDLDESEDLSGLYKETVGSLLKGRVNYQNLDIRTKVQLCTLLHFKEGSKPIKVNKDFVMCLVRMVTEFMNREKIMNFLGEKFGENNGEPSDEERKLATSCVEENIETSEKIVKMLGLWFLEQNCEELKRDFKAEQTMN